MSLLEVAIDQTVKILQIPDEMIRSQAIRLGIGQGSVVTCLERIPSGPIIIRRNHQEIAIGHGLAQEIIVEPLEEAR